MASFLLLRDFVDNEFLGLTIGYIGVYLAQDFIIHISGSLFYPPVLVRNSMRAEVLTS